MYIVLFSALFTHLERKISLSLSKKKVSLKRSLVLYSWKIYNISHLFIFYRFWCENLDKFLTDYASFSLKLIYSHHSLFLCWFVCFVRSDEGHAVSSEVRIKISRFAKVTSTHLTDVLTFTVLQ